MFAQMLPKKNLCIPLEIEGEEMSRHDPAGPPGLTRRRFVRDACASGAALALPGVRSVQTMPIDFGESS